MMILFKILWAIDALASLVVLYFFLVGLADGSVSSRNAGLWTLTVLGVVAIMGGSLWCKHQGYIIPAYIILSVAALPVLFFAGYMLMVLLAGKSAWQ